MKAMSFLEMAYEALKERKTRSALTIVGILIGPAAIIGITSMVGGYRSYITSQLLKLGTNTMAVLPSGSYSLTQRDVQIISGLSGVKGVFPYYYIPAIISTSAGNEDVYLFAINAQQGLEEAVPGISLLSGGYPQAYQTSAAVLGYLVANPRNPYYPHYKTGQVINLQVYSDGRLVQKSFLITGVLKQFGQSFFVNVDEDVFVPLATGQQLTGSSVYSGILVVVYSASAVNSVSAKLQSLYGTQITVYTAQQGISIANSIIGSLNALLVSAAAISLLVAFVGVTTTMFTSIVERTREIGLLKALGFTNKDVIGMFVAESALMGLIGGAAGSILGIAVAYLLSYLRPASGLGLTSLIPPVISVETVVMAFGLSLLVGITAGMIPAYRASRLMPVEALRHE
jgi:ABC-type antimicrobial peptide transport system permease subunit